MCIYLVSLINQLFQNYVPFLMLAITLVFIGWFRYANAKVTFSLFLF